MISGVYIHVPYCRQLCHYCDFAKTANYGNEHFTNYLIVLADHCRTWIEATQPTTKSIESVFLGGGTPSLYGGAWQIVFDVLSPYLKTDAEITIEANPDDISESKLYEWTKVGINRLSIGVQTFDDSGLKFMNRVHSSADAVHALTAAKEQFDNVNIDLIYGWPDHSIEIWKKDLKLAAEFAPHLSLYNLTYEPQTPIGRMMNRGRLQMPPDDRLEEYYRVACEALASEDYNHEEVSNWSLQGYSCAHNWLYWRNKYFLGIGTGAHGYLPVGDFGMRYSYSRNDRSFQKSIPFKIDSIGSFIGAADLVEVEGGRNLEQWLIEFVGTGLRTSEGISIKSALQKTKGQFVPTMLLEEGMQKNMITFNGDQLILDNSEWFRENAWAVEVINSFKK